MCKSILANWVTLDEDIKAFIDKYRTSDFNDDIPLKYYTNFIKPTAAQSNLLLESTTDTIIEDLVDTGLGVSEAIIDLDTYENGVGDDRSFDFIAIKFNKLDKALMKQLLTTDVTIRFYDQFNANPVNEASFTMRKRLPYFLNANANQIFSDRFDANEGVFYIDAQEIAKLNNLQDRNGDPTDKLYHDSIQIIFQVNNTDKIISYVSLSNITLTNGLEVELENGVMVDYKSLDIISQSKQGKEFIDKNNTKKECMFNIPLLDKDEFRFLERNYFKLFDQRPFFLFPLSGDSEIYENLDFGGYYKVAGSYKPERENVNVYNIKFKTKEVI